MTDDPILKNGKLYSKADDPALHRSGRMRITRTDPGERYRVIVDNDGWRRVRDASAMAAVPPVANSCGDGSRVTWRG